MANDTSEQTIYQKYLGVAGRQVPPDHYTLLGVQPLESDPDTLRSALKRRLELLAQKKNDENAPDVERLEKELQEAVECLTSEGARDSYERGVTGEAAKKGIQMASFAETENEAEASSVQAGTVPHPGTVTHPGTVPYPGGLYAQPGMMPHPGMTPNGEAAAHGGVCAQPRTAFMPVASGAEEDPYARFSRMQGTGSAGGLDFGAGAASSGRASSGSRSAGASARRSTGASRKKTASNVPAIPMSVVIGAFVIMVLIFAGIHSVNSDSGRAKKLHIEAMSAVNSGDFERGRKLIEMAIQLDPQEEYVRYQEQIDKKEKQSEMRQKRQEFYDAEADEEFDFSIE